MCEGRQGRANVLCVFIFACMCILYLCMWMCRNVCVYAWIILKDTENGGLEILDDTVFLLVYMSTNCH